MAGTGLTLATKSLPQISLVWCSQDALHADPKSFPGNLSPIRNGSTLCSENWRENTAGNQTSRSHTARLWAGEGAAGSCTGMWEESGDLPHTWNQGQGSAEDKHFPCSPQTGWEPPCSYKQTPQKPLQSWWCLAEGPTVATAPAEGKHRPRGTVCGTGEPRSQWLVPVTLTSWCLPPWPWIRLDGQLGVLPIKDSPFSSFPFCLSLG